MTTRRIAVLSLFLFWVAFGVIVARAVASPFTPPEDVAFEQALTYWNVTEIPACSVITKEVVVGLEDEGKIVGGDATQTYPGYYEPCVLNINALDPLCSLEHIFEHEVGHLLGHTHAEGGVMDPSFDYPECQPSVAATPEAVVEHPTPEDREQESARIHATLAQITKENNEQYKRRWRKHHVIRRQNL